LEDPSVHESKTDSKEVKCEDINSVHLAQDTDKCPASLSMKLFDYLTNYHILKKDLISYSYS
jgi:hypothetical protein